MNLILILIKQNILLAFFRRIFCLSSAGYLNFSDTIKLLKVRGDAMQNAVPKGEGGMLAVLGSTVESIEKILQDNQKNFTAQIANDNSEGQIVLSGKNNDLR